MEVPILWAEFYEFILLDISSNHSTWTQTPRGATPDEPLEGPGPPAACPPYLEYLAQIADLLPLIVLSVNQ